MGQQEDNDIQVENLRLQQKQVELQTQNSKVLPELVDKVQPIAEKYLEYLNKKLEKIEGPKIRWSIIGFVGLLLVIVLVSGVLVYANKLDSSSFTLVLGTMIGATLTLLGDIVLLQE